MKFLQQSTTSERVTAVVSTVFAIVILGVAVSAQQQGSAPDAAPSDVAQSTSPEQGREDLAQLERELIMQLDIAYRHDQRLQDLRVEQFNEVLLAWQTAKPSPERDAKMARWMRAAMRVAMPGRNAPFPAIPNFKGARDRVVARTPDFIVPEEHSRGPIPAGGPVPDLADPLPSEPNFNEPLADEPLAEKPLTEKITVAKAESPFSNQLLAVVQTETNELPTHTQGQGPQPPAVSVDRDFTVAARQPSIDINTHELAVRTHGYHQGIREVEATLVNVQWGANAPKNQSVDLAQVVDTLEELQSEYELIDLYYDLVNADQRRSLPTPQPLEPTLSRVLRQLDSVGADGTVLVESLSARQHEKLRELLAKVSRD